MSELAGVSGLVNLVIGIGALLVAIWSAFIAYRTSTRQTHLQERLVALEHKRERDRKVALQQANLRADLLPGAWNSYNLRIFNDGPGQAQAIQIYIDDVPLADSEHIAGKSDIVTTLGPGAQVKYHVLAFLGMKSTMFRVRLLWADATGTDRQWESELKL